jgi:uncharacterized protein YdeI (YjbR/CyaY-like superfamily)
MMKSVSKPADLPIVMCGSAVAWEQWLEQHHATERGVWLRLARSGSSLQSVSRADALDLALCFGWIDGQARRFDDDTWLQRFTPRTKKSIWSKRNREHVGRLIAEGRMRLSGMAAIEAAKQDGRWERAYDSPTTATVPEDLREALEAAPDAKQFFETLRSADRYAILYRIQTAVKPETRARWIARFVETLARRETLRP